MSNEKIKKYLIFANLLLGIDFNLYSFLFIFINIFYSMKQIHIKNIYLLNSISLFILFIEYLNFESFKYYFYLLIIFVISVIIYFFNKSIEIIIFHIIFNLLKSCRSFFNSNLKYEFNELGLKLTILN